MLTESVLLSTKKVLNIPGTQDAFDQDILTHVNSAFSVLSQLGLLVEEGVYVDDEALTWADLELPDPWIQLIRTYVFLNTQLLFDPPTTSFLLAARKQQLDEHVWRLSMLREYSIREEESDEDDDEL